MAIQEPAPREDGVKIAGDRVRGHVTAQEPASCLKTRGGSGAYPVGGKSRSRWPPDLGTRGGTGAYPVPNDTWWLGSPSRRREDL
jgi:hypothetical protein